MIRITALLVALVAASPAHADPSTADARLLAAQEEDIGDQADRGDHAANFATDIAQAAPAATLPPAQGGEWVRLPNVPKGFNPIHAVPGPNTKILLVAGSGNLGGNFISKNFQSYVYTASKRTWTKVTTPDDLFCAGHVVLPPNAQHPGGWALVAGGTSDYSPFRGINKAYAFDFGRMRYEALTPMEFGRWYPTATHLRSGKQLFTGGFNTDGKRVQHAEIFDPTTSTWTTLPGEQDFPNYPGLRDTARGVFYDGTASGNAKLHAPGFWQPQPNTFQPVPGLRVPNARNTASACYLGDVRAQNLYVIGGLGGNVLSPGGTNLVDKINLKAPSPAFTPGPPLHAAKGYPSCTTLPDGSILEAGGGRANRLASAVFEASILHPGGVDWTTVNPNPDQRLYHSFLCPLDSGAVLSLTSNPKGGDAWSTSMLIYRPPYMYQGAQPKLAAAPGRMTYGGTYTVSARGATKVSLTAISSPTHSRDPNQRASIFPLVGERFRLAAKNTDLPPGQYRLWALNANNVPSAARQVTVS